MSKKRVKAVDKIVLINGVRYVVRYVNGVAVGKMAFSDLEKYAKITR